MVLERTDLSGSIAERRNAPDVGTAETSPPDLKQPIGLKLMQCGPDRDVRDSQGVGELELAGEPLAGADHSEQDQSAQLLGSVLVRPALRQRAERELSRLQGGAGRSLAGLRSKKPVGRSENPIRATGITGQSSGRGR